MSDARGAARQTKIDRPTSRLVSLAIGILAVGILFLAPASLASTASANTMLAQRVEAFLMEQARDLGRDISITVHQGSVRLPACQDPQPFLTNPDQRMYGRVSVGLRCGEDNRQVRYVQADVSVLVDHVVTARDIEAGATISASDLKMEEARLERLPRHALLAFDEAIGLTAARPLRADTTLQTHFLRRPVLVARGDRVTVTARGPGFSVSRDVKALDNGSLGDEIRLATDTGEQLKATVTGPNQLKVRL